MTDDATCERWLYDRLLKGLAVAYADVKAWYADWLEDARAGVRADESAAFLNMESAKNQRARFEGAAAVLLSSQDYERLLREAREQADAMILATLEG